MINNNSVSCLWCWGLSPFLAKFVTRVLSPMIYSMAQWQNSVLSADTRAHPFENRTEQNISNRTPAFPKYSHKYNIFSFPHRRCIYTCRVNDMVGIDFFLQWRIDDRGTKVVLTCLRFIRRSGRVCVILSFQQIYNAKSHLNQYTQTTIDKDYDRRCGQ